MYQPVRLARPHGDGRHPYVDATGAFIGRGTALLESAPNAIGRACFRPRPVAHLNALLAKGYGMSRDCARLAIHLRAVASALNEGNLARAAIALVHAKLPALPDEAAAERLAKADRELRERIAKWREERVAVVDASGLIKYSPDQPRVPKRQPGGGQWTTSGGAVRIAGNNEGDGSTTDFARQPSQRSSRGLTSGEIALARSVFGERIDYSKVVIEPNSMWPRHDREAVTLSNTINFSNDSEVYREDFSTASESDKAFLLHEMTHVLQNQNDVSTAVAHVLFPEYKYELQVDDNGSVRRPFSSYEVEQQAMIVEDYYRTLHGLGPAKEIEAGVNQQRYPLSAYRAVLHIQPDGTIGADAKRPGKTPIGR